MNYKKSILASAVAFILATSCCWLPFLAIALGGAASLASFNAQLENFSTSFMILGGVLFSLGLYQYFFRHKKKEVLLKSKISCPKCYYSKIEIMPINACQFFYECEKCNEILKPKDGDCCVYCSYGTVPCPPIQKDESCC